MKNSILALALFFSMSLIVMSCKDSKKQADTETEVEQTDHVVEKAEMAMNDAYKCPMDCEDGKTYDKEGKCPVCKMNLKKVVSDSDKDEPEEHEHKN